MIRKREQKEKESLSFSSFFFARRRGKQRLVFCCHEVCFFSLSLPLFSFLRSFFPSFFSFYKRAACVCFNFISLKKVRY